MCDGRDIGDWIEARSGPAVNRRAQVLPARCGITRDALLQPECRTAGGECGRVEA
jgi:hypothetical protein